MRATSFPMNGILSTKKVGIGKSVVEGNTIIRALRPRQICSAGDAPASPGKPAQKQGNG